MGEALAEAFFASLYGLCLLIGIVAGLLSFSVPIGLLIAADDMDSDRARSYRKAAVVVPFVCVPLAVAMWPLGRFFWKLW